ncbi:uncharacterized protein LOC116853019 [Odontomachus brunneus]|uniref:uncharacterized protein LOC116853019 n=1 Tax=Odontomachus brunneus TaxID=486640 RepID=UPI0013F237F6|nr:uncharacterized protein LOC116853019 [Odontomachus brunneus]
MLRKNAKWKWGIEQEKAFRELKTKLTTTPVLACPDFTKKFVIQTDASTEGLGAVLTQRLDNEERVIAYASRTLDRAERNYSATELECLAVVWGIRRLRDYLEGYRFTVITDHQSLRWLQKVEAPTGRLARWIIELQQYDFEIQYRRGSLNTVADALSRQPQICTITTACQWYRKIKSQLQKVEAPTGRLARWIIELQQYDFEIQYRRGSLNTVADALSRQPQIYTVTTACQWYREIKSQVAEEPNTRPDYKVIEGKLMRHILHNLDFNETRAEEQWKEHGCPHTIISDNGTQLKSQQLAQMLTAHNIKHRTTPVHAPHCNPVERTNRVVKTMVAQYVGRDHRKWDVHLPALQFAYNTAVQESTGYSPAYLNYGREIDTTPDKTDGREEPASRQKRLREANELLRINLARAFQRQEKYYNLRRRNWKPKTDEKDLKPQNNNSEEDDEGDTKSNI